jgi:hypothetical protein
MVLRKISAKTLVVGQKLKLWHPNSHFCLSLPAWQQSLHQPFRFDDPNAGIDSSTLNAISPSQWR